MNRFARVSITFVFVLSILVSISSCQQPRTESVVSEINSFTSSESVSVVSKPDPYPNLSGFENEYTQAYIDANKNKVSYLQKDNGLTFITVQDLHVSSLDDDRYDRLRDIVIITEQFNVDYVVVLGDLTAGIFEHDDAIALLEKVKEIMDQCHCPVFYTRGDHEYNAENETVGTDEADYKKIITARDWDSIFGDYGNLEVVKDTANIDGGYYYVDMPEKKNRIIVLNSFEFKANADGTPYINDDGSMGYWISKIRSEEQITWLTRKALNMSGKTDWTVSFFSHMIPYNDDLSTDDRTFHGYGSDNKPIRMIIQAFQNGSTWSGEYNSDVGDISVDFRKQGKIKVTGWYSGHIHDDCFERVDELNMFVSTCTCNAVRDSWANDETPEKLPPDRNDTDKAMSVNMFIADRDHAEVHVVKFGSEADKFTETFYY